MTSLKRSVFAAAGIAIASGAWGVEPTGLAIEFYDANLRRHYLTADAAEIAQIDAGRRGAGWTRTGGRFGVYAAEGDSPDSVPVCRFALYAAAGPVASFYSADPDECERVRQAGVLRDEGIAFHAGKSAYGQCSEGTTPVARTAATLGNAEVPDFRHGVDATVVARAVSAGAEYTGAVFCAPLSSADIEADSLRLLRQATFGPTEPELARLRSLGAMAWIEEQFSLPATPYTTYPYVAANRPATCVDDRSLPVRPDSYCARDNYSLFPLQLEFFRNALSQPDQLRARVAFALAQIMVTSGVSNARNYAMRNYQQIFLDKAFGNYYDLLLAVTLSPVMGDYLNMANNNKANATTGTNPNENYAREVLQLFSIGLYALNPDGTLNRDAAGKPIPTYDLDEIEGFARVFTGWTFPTIPGATARNTNPRNYDGNMIAVTANHEFGAKQLLDGVIAPAAMTMQDDLAFAMRNIFNHPNVGPFIGKQLIQKLVTSDPTPGYVARVSAAFADNGAGVRGDLKAVVRAILTDPEARGARKIDPQYGKLSEPVLYMTTLTRALGGRTDGAYFRGASSQLGQFIFYPPTVFNYYPPDFHVPGTSVLGPEFGIQTTSTAVSRANVANALVFSAQIAPDASVYGATGTALDLSAYAAVAGNAGVLADRLDRFLLAGRMSPAMKSAIVSAVGAVPATDLLGRARAAAYLVVTSPHFQVER